MKLVNELMPCNNENSPENDQRRSLTKNDPASINNEGQATFPAELSGSLESSNMGNSITAGTFQEMFASPLDICAGDNPLHLQRSPNDIYNTQEQLAFVSQLKDNIVPTGVEPSLSTANLRKNLSCPVNFYNQNPTVRQNQPPPDPRLGLTFLPLAADEEKWDVSNDAFLRALQSTVFISSPDQVDPDVPFKAIFGGWHTVDAREREKPIWNMLRLIDERVFGMWTSKIQKVALMYVTHALVKVCSPV